MIPSSIKTRYYIHNKIRGEKGKLKSIPRIHCHTGNLMFYENLSGKDLFYSQEIESTWNEAKKKMDSFNIPDGTGGVNPGDRRAIYYLVSQLKPASVLEVGTHIGASTLHIAAALDMSRIRQGEKAELTTVDIADVNCPETKPWLEYGVSRSPGEMVNRLSYGSFVNFVAGASIQYFENCDQRFDFIFLDGDQSASTVYQEIPAALKLLKPNGIILLHDYFPQMKSLWSNGSVLPGPFLAVNRLVKEGASLAVLPLGSLPWPTKLKSNVTSLALLMKKE